MSNPTTDPANEPLLLRGRWLLVARVGWVGVALLTVIILALLIARGPYRLLLETDISNAFAPLQDLMSFKAFARLVLIARYVTLATYLATAFFIFWRKSHEVIGLITSLTLLLLPSLFNLGGAVPITPQSGLNRLLGWSWPLAMMGFFALFVFLIVFPTGRFSSPRIRRLFWWGMGVAVLIAILSTVVGERIWPYTEVVGVAIIIWFILLGFAAQVYRYLRISGPLERQQTQLVFASLMLIIVWSFSVAIWSPFRSWSAWSGLWGLLKIFGTVIVLSLLPLSLARAILRYHLWDIDFIVRKTLVYSALTGFLALVYFTSIVVLQRLLAPLTGDSTLATILSTLLIAALFLPVRRRIQAIIDRRFFRRKYNAEQVLADFAATARDETDLDKLTAELLRVIQETMEPEHVSIWLKPTTDQGRLSSPDDRPLTTDR